MARLAEGAFMNRSLALFGSIFIHAALLGGVFVFELARQMNASAPAESSASAVEVAPVEVKAEEAVQKPEAKTIEPAVVAETTPVRDAIKKPKVKKIVQTEVQEPVKEAAAESSRVIIPPKTKKIYLNMADDGSKKSATNAVATEPQADESPKAIIEKANEEAAAEEPARPPLAQKLEDKEAVKTERTATDHSSNDIESAEPAVSDGI